MRLLFKIITILIVAILVLSSVYIVFFLKEDNDKLNDTTPPTIGTITGNLNGTSGKIVTVFITFSDNENVTEADIYYKSANSEEWKIGSILSGSFDIEIPSNSDDNWYYYVTVNDAAGNGPVGNPSNDGSIYYIITVTESAEDLVHTVFIEEATAQWCIYCPAVGEVIHDLYKSGNYNFYYVSMVQDMNTDDNNLAHQRLEGDYNILGYPTIYIDGGYKLITGGAEKKDDVDVSKYTEAIQTAEKRIVPEIKVTVDVYYENNSNEFETNVVVKNFEKETYNGQLKVYLAEIISRWNYKTGGQIHNGFLDYIVNEKISVNAGGEYKITKNWSLSGLDPENLMVIAVVFSSESVKSYSNPTGSTEEDKHPFDAYFADATNGALVIAEGNLPPYISIDNPVAGKLHFLGIPLFKTLLKKTVLIGPTKITVNANDDSKVEKVEFYVDGKLIFTDNEAPYEYTLRRIGLFKSIFFRKHIILVNAYDDSGKVSSDELEFLARL